MAVELSVKAKALLSQVGISPQIILDIEGVDLIFGAQPVLKTLFWDDGNAKWDVGLHWDGAIENVISRDYISLPGTTSSITQQIAPDKGGTSSISTVNITLIDKDGEVSSAFSFDKIKEILGRKATFSIGFSDGIYPEDAQAIYRGVVVDFYTEAGAVMISLASSESLKRQVLLPKIQTDIVGNITSSQTSLNVELSEGIVLGAESLTTYIAVDDELMRVTNIPSSTLINIERGQLGTIAKTHDGDASVETFYRLRGGPLDLALKIMLSNKGNSYFQSLDVPSSIEYVNAATAIENALIFKYYDIKDKTGLTIGDKFKLSSTGNIGTYTVKSFGKVEGVGSYIQAVENLSTEPEYIGTFEYISQFNVLPVGLSMLTSEVDVQQFLDIKSQFGSSFVDYDIYIKDSIDNAKDFIDKQLFFPQGLFSIPRKARSSVKFIVPPFSSDIVPEININNIVNASSVKQRRSVHKYLYNVYVFRYNLSATNDKYLSGNVIIAADSEARIQVGKQQLKIESDGLRPTPDTERLINNTGQRLLERYQFAPVYFEKIEVLYKTGYAIEVGDVVPFGGESLGYVNLQTGKRGSSLKLFEVINKTLDVKTGKITLSLLSTAFDVNARYAVVSMGSKIGATSTPSRIKILTTNDTGEHATESEKWVDYEGQTVRVRSSDYVHDENIVFKGVDPTDSSFLILDGSLSFTPLNDYIVEPSIYDDSDASANAKFKLSFVHLVGKATITSVTSSFIFEVDDVTKLVAGSNIYVHSKDYLRDSFKDLVGIDSIVDNVVTLNNSLGFTPQIGDVIERSKFLDGGDPYILL